MVAADISLERLSTLKEREQQLFNERTQTSRALYGRARHTHSRGVASSFHIRDPWPVYLSEGRGSRVWDADGNELIDFNYGAGALVQGHAHPAITEAVCRRLERGTHFAGPVEDQFLVSEELARRFGLPKWRFTNTGSEATMDAIRIARGLTGRDTIVKIFGAYHGHHDAVMISIGGSAEGTLDRNHYPSIPWGDGIPKAVAELTVAVPFNDADVMTRTIERLIDEGRAPACVIMEAAMMNLGVIAPAPGYLEAVREVTRKHGAVLIFDEVKTGLTMAAGGATEQFGVTPDMVTLGKALGAGLPCAAIGGRDDVMDVVEQRVVQQVGTFNGNPLALTAARASLLEVLTPSAYKHLDTLNERIVSACSEVVASFELPAYVVGFASKGCIVFSDGPVFDCESFEANQHQALTELAWLYNVNRGILMSPARGEQWTLSVAHSDEDCDRYAAVLAEMAAEVLPGKKRGAAPIRKNPA